MKFSISNVLMLTAVVAIIFAIPSVETVSALAIGSICFLGVSLSLLGFAYFSHEKRKKRQAVSERVMLNFLVRLILAFALISLVGAIATGIRVVNG